jgi:hypothetical protein
MNSDINRMKRIPGMIVTVLVIIGIGWTMLNWKHLVAMPKNISAHTAKQYCSCLLVMKLNEQYCRDYSDPGYPVSELNYDASSQAVTVSALGFSTMAKYYGNRFGCRIDD